MSWKLVTLNLNFKVKCHENSNDPQFCEYKEITLIIHPETRHHCAAWPGREP